MSQIYFELESIRKNQSSNFRGFIVSCLYLNESDKIILKVSFFIVNKMWTLIFYASSMDDFQNT